MYYGRFENRVVTAEDFPISSVLPYPQELFNFLLWSGLNEIKILAVKVTASAVAKFRLAQDRYRKCLLRPLNLPFKYL